MQTSENLPVSSEQFPAGEPRHSSKKKVIVAIVALLILAGVVLTFTFVDTGDMFQGRFFKIYRATDETVKSADTYTSEPTSHKVYTPEAMTQKFAPSKKASR